MNVENSCAANFSRNYDFFFVLKLQTVDQKNKYKCKKRTVSSFPSPHVTLLLFECLLGNIL